MSQLLKNIFSYTGAIILQKIISFLYFTFVARSLGPTLTGAFFLGVSLTQLFSALCDIGIGNFLIRESTQKREQTEKLFGYFYGIRIVLAVLSYTGVLVSAVLLDYPTTVVIISAVAGVAMVLDSFNSVNYAVLRGHQFLKAESIGVIVFQATLAAVGTLIIILSRNIILLSLALVAASAVNYLISLLFLKKKTAFVPHFQFNWSQFFTIVKQSLPFAFIAIFARLYTQTDIIMLSKMGCALRDCIQDVGLYTVAVKATLVIQSVPLAFMAAIYPALSELFVRNLPLCRSVLLQTLRYLLVIVAGIVVVFSVFGDQAVQFVWGRDYAGSVSPLQILLGGSIFVIAAYPMGALLNAAKFQSTYAFFTLFALFANVVLNAFLIPVWGVQGAAWASVLGSLLLVIFAMRKVSKVLPHIFQGIDRVWGGIIFSAAGAWVIGMLLKDVYFIFGSLMIGGIYLVLLIFSKTISLSDVAILRSSLKKPTTGEEPLV